MDFDSPHARVWNRMHVRKGMKPKDGNYSITIPIHSTRYDHNFNYFMNHCHSKQSLSFNYFSPFFPISRWLKNCTYLLFSEYMYRMGITPISIGEKKGRVSSL